MNWWQSLLVIFVSYAAGWIHGFSNGLGKIQEVENKVKEIENYKNEIIQRFDNLEAPKSSKLQ